MRSDPSSPSMNHENRSSGSNGQAELGQDAAREFGEVDGAAAVDEEITVLLDGHWGDPAHHGDELFSTEVSSLVEVVGQAFAQGSV